MPMNRKLVGQTYPACEYTVTAEAIKSYARTTNEFETLNPEGEALISDGIAQVRESSS